MRRVGSLLLVVPITLYFALAMAWAVAARMYDRFCMRCPHHKIEHDGKCEMGDYRPGNYYAMVRLDDGTYGYTPEHPDGRGRRWNYPENIGWCQCEGFIGIPWGKGNPRAFRSLSVT